MSWAINGVGKKVLMFFTFSDYPYLWQISYRRQMGILTLLFKPNQSTENNSSGKNKNVIIAFKSLSFSILPIAKIVVLAMLKIMIYFLDLWQGIIN